MHIVFVMREDKHLLKHANCILSAEARFYHCVMWFSSSWSDQFLLWFLDCLPEKIGPICQIIVINFVILTHNMSRHSAIKCIYIFTKLIFTFFMCNYIYSTEIDVPTW